MSSQGTGSLISPSDANDLLHKLITESTKVQAAFGGVVPGLAAVVTGVLKISPDTGVIWVTGGNPLFASQLAFDPEQATARTYGDLRAFGATAQAIETGAPRVVAALAFVFADNSQLTLFEMAETL